MVVVAQLVRALDCGSRGRRFEPGLPPDNQSPAFFNEVQGFILKFEVLVILFGRLIHRYPVSSVRYFPSGVENKTGPFLK